LYLGRFLLKVTVQCHEIFNSGLIQVFFTNQFPLEPFWIILKIRWDIRSGKWTNLQAEKFELFFDTFG